MLKRDPHPKNRTVLVPCSFMATTGDYSIKEVSMAAVVFINSLKSLMPVDECVSRDIYFKHHLITFQNLLGLP